MAAIKRPMVAESLCCGPLRCTGGPICSLFYARILHTMLARQKLAALINFGDQIKEGKLQGHGNQIINITMYSKL
jgi:hypothetical protein